MSLRDTIYQMAKDIGTVVAGQKSLREDLAELKASRNTVTHSCRRIRTLEIIVAAVGLLAMISLVINNYTAPYILPVMEKIL